MLYLTLVAWPLLTHRRVDTVVSAEVVEADVIHPTTNVSQTHKQRSDNARLVSRLPDLLIDAAPTTVDRAVLPRHDEAQRALLLDVAREPGHLGNADDDLELAALLRRAHDALDERLGDEVHDLLALAGGGDAGGDVRVVRLWPKGGQGQTHKNWFSM